MGEFTLTIDMPGSRSLEYMSQALDDHHRIFWEDYSRKYSYNSSIESLLQEHLQDMSPGYYGPRSESYEWNHTALSVPACPCCYRAAVSAYKDYPRRAMRGVTHYMGISWYGLSTLKSLFNRCKTLVLESD